jgi:hypothetical protein
VGGLNLLQDPAAVITFDFRGTSLDDRLLRAHAQVSQCLLRGSGVVLVQPPLESANALTEVSSPICCYLAHPFVNLVAQKLA